MSIDILECARNMDRDMAHDMAHDMAREMDGAMDREIDPEINRKINVSNLTGEWVNVSNQVGYIEALSVYIEGSELKLKILSANPEYDMSSQCHKITAYAESDGNQASGFYLHDETGCVLCVNEKNGVLVIQSYLNTTSLNTTNLNIANPNITNPNITNPNITEENQVLNILTREFYCKKIPDNKVSMPSEMGGDMEGDMVAVAPPTDCFMKAGGDTNLIAMNGYENVLGSWRNTNSSTKWIGSILIQKKNSEFFFKLYSKNKKHIWPEASFIPCSLDANEYGFSCCLYFDNLKSFFSVYSNKGLLVITAFYSMCKNNEIINTMSREFYTKKTL